MVFLFSYPPSSPSPLPKMPFLSTDNVVSCPYDKSHQVLRHKLSQHLVRCARQHPDARMSVCPFNSAHHVPDTKFGYHKRHCPDRVTVEREKYPLYPPHGVVEALNRERERADAEDEDRKANARRVHECEEDWEKEAGEGTGT